MDRDALKKEVENALRLSALLFGAIAGIVLVMIVLLVLSIFGEVGLPTAFLLQCLMGALGAGAVLWRMS